VAALEKTDWQSKILLELAFFMNGFPESTDVSWRVIRPTMNAYRAAVELVTGLDATYVPWPRIAPDREGGIQFEWDTLEIGVLPTGSYEYLRVVGESKTQEGQITLSKAWQFIAALARR